MSAGTALRDCRRVPAKNVLLLVGAILTLPASLTFAGALSVAVATTPYDRQMARVRTVLSAGGTAVDQTSILIVNHWIDDLRRVPYIYDLEWRTPSEVEARGRADCKGKALTLYRWMRSYGARNVRLIVGMRAPTDQLTHTWLEWDKDGSSYVLDPTFNDRITPVEEVGGGRYVRLYAYAGVQKFCAVDRLVAQGALSRKPPALGTSDTRKSTRHGSRATTNVPYPASGNARRLKQ